MEVGKSVSKAIEEWQNGDLDSAMLHACIAVDGTAAKEFPRLGSNARFTRLLRENYVILGRMGMPGIDLANTPFPVEVQTPKGPGGVPDLADVIYGIHRSKQAHGEALPREFELISDAAGPLNETTIIFGQGRVRLSDRIIFGLLAVAVTSPSNVGQRGYEGFWLSYEDKRFVINDWWGKREEFLASISRTSLPSVKLDFRDWVPPPK